MREFVIEIHKEDLLAEAKRCLKCKVLFENNPLGAISAVVCPHENGMTNIPGVFAAGDVVSGPKTVVEAVAHTKKVAEHMVSYCYNKRN